MKGKDHLGDLHVDKIRSAVLELHAVRYDVLFWVQFPEKNRMRSCQSNTEPSFY
jgi:hypothetical protein